MSIRRSRYRGLPRSYLLHLITLVLVLLASMGSAFAGSVNLAWDAASGASGYRVYYGTTPAKYTANLDAGNKTNATVAGLTDGTRYYFAVLAYAGTVTSGYSNEVSTIVAPATTAPVAHFTANGSTASSLSVTPGQTVTLVDTSTGTVASRSWNLGDGNSATSTTVVQSYATTGAKTVVLSVTGAGVTATASKTINVTAAAPVASFGASPITGTAPLAVKFTDASSGSISSWSWSFGHGATSTAQSPTYTYASPGTYTVSVTAAGPGGSNTVTKTAYITVTTADGSLGGGSGVSTAGLVAAYGFDETSGTQVLDATGNGNHGTLSNATRTSQAKFGSALSFSGSNSLVTVSDSSSLDLTSGMTLSAWVYPTSWASGWKTVILKERSGGLAYALDSNSDAGLPNSTLSIGGYDRQLSAGNHLPSNTWTHLAATYDGTRQRLYVNGVQVGSRAQTGTLAVSASPLRIGGNTVWANEYFQGLIDEVRIYNRALTQAEIAAVSEKPVSQAASVCATPCSLWDSTPIPNVTAAADTRAVEVGVKIRSSVDGLITGVRFYKGSQNTGTHVGRLWSSTGQLLAQATFTNETASGWQQVNLATPVAIKANTVYVVSYHAPVARYATNEGFFASAYTKGPLRALSNTEAGGNGVYRYGSGGVFPTGTYGSTNYWVDALFKTP
jgi:PKD repeat protein